MSLLDIIGPVMVGPSSSHTAGACRLALLARYTLIEAPQEASLELHGSFAKTGVGHGTHLALIAGLLGFFPHDERIPQANAHARQAGLKFNIGAKDLGDVHPNTVRFKLSNASETITVMGSSLGGGIVKVFRLNDFETSLSGSYHSLLIEHADQPGVIARVARVLADDEVNIATMFSSRQKRGGRAMMTLEIDRQPPQYALDYLRQQPSIHWLRILPEVMSSDAE